jgi:deoxyadenosine/deoxycytidine kinase
MLLKKSIDHFVWLDASDDLLMARINGRSKRHRIKHVSEGDAKRFLGDYRQCLRELVGSELPDAPVTTIDTERLSVAECADIVARIGQYSL